MKKLFLFAFALLMAAGAQAVRMDIGTLANGSTYTAQDGDELYGTISGRDVKIVIAKNATVTLDGVSINKNHEIQDGDHAGISTLGDATIIFQGTNYVCGFGNLEPGIYPAKNATLTLMETPLEGGTLYATSGADQFGDKLGAGIGAGSYHDDRNASCGNIRICSGNIIATGGLAAAGIGGAHETSCGYIYIMGGNVTATGGNFAAGIGTGNHVASYVSTSAECGNITICSDFYIDATGEVAPTIVTATGGDYAAGIGCGENGKCGMITICEDVTRLTATKGSYAPYSIGKGNDNNYTSTCGSINIGGTVYPNGVSESPFVFPAIPATCATPTNLCVTGKTATSATITWTPGSTGQTMWEVAYHKKLYGWKYKTVYGTTYTMTDLDPNATYEVRIRAKCDTDVYSEFSDIVTFTTPSESTPAECQKPMNVKVSNITATSAMVTWTDTNPTGTEYDVCYMKPMDAGYVYKTTSFFFSSLMGLQPDTEYDVWVQAHCGTSGYSDNSATVRIRTLQETTEGIDEILDKKDADHQKFIIDGHLVIKVGNKLYDAQGKELR